MNMPVILLAVTLAGAGSIETEPETETEMSREVDSDLFNVAHLMMGEAGYTDSTERRLTASVLLNRVDSDLFPDTIGECLYQPGQYSTVRDGGPFWKEPTEDCWRDAEDLLSRWYETGDTDLPENVLYQSLFPQGSGTYLISDWGQYFCYALSGTLTVGTSTITVSYGGKTTTFTVTVTEYRGIPENYTWLYDARSGELLSEQEYVSKTTSGGTTSETIIDDFLRIHADNNGTTSGSSSVLLTFQFSDTTTTNGILTTRLKPIDLANDDGAGGVGIQLQLSNGSSGSQVWVEENKENAGHILISFYTGGTRNKVSTNFLVDEYHVFEVSLQNGKQALSIDGTQVYESSTLSTNYTSVNRVRLQGVGSSRCPNGITADIDWLTFYEVS